MLKTIIKLKNICFFFFLFKFYFLIDFFLIFVVLFFFIFCLCFKKIKDICFFIIFFYLIKETHMTIDSRNIHIYITKISDIIISVVSLSMSLWIYELLHGQYISLPDLLHIKIKMINIISLLAYLLIYNITLHSIEIYDHKRIQGWREEYRHISK